MVSTSSHIRSGPQAAYAAEGCQPVLQGRSRTNIKRLYQIGRSVIFIELNLRGPTTPGFLGLQTISDLHPSSYLLHWTISENSDLGRDLLVHLAKEHLLLFKIVQGG